MFWSRKVKEFVLVESDETIAIDVRDAIAVKYEIKEAANHTIIKGTQIIFPLGVGFWVKGEYDEIRNRVFGRAK